MTIASHESDKSLRNKTVLVTGGAGFIGARAVRLLLGRAKTVRVASIEKNPKRLSDLMDQIDYFPVDLHDTDSLPKILNGVDDVLHFAATGLKWKTNSSLESLLLNNTVATYNLITEAGRQKVRRIVVAGSVFEYGGRACPSNGTRKISTSMKQCPQNLYGLTKAAATLIVPLVGNMAEIETISLRVFFPYGPGEPVYRLVPHVILSAQRGSRIRTTKGEQKRDFCYVDDVANAFIQALTISCPGHLEFNLGTGIATSIKKATKLILSKINTTSELKLGAIPYRKNEAFHLVADTSDLDPRLADCLTTPLDKGIEETIAWFQTHGDKLL